jgi:hypothetical protein
VHSAQLAALGRGGALCTARARAGGHRRRKHLRVGRAPAAGRLQAKRAQARRPSPCGIGPASPLAQCDHRRAPGWRLMGIP